MKANFYVNETTGSRRLYGIDLSYEIDETETITQASATTYAKDGSSLDSSSNPQADIVSPIIYVMVTVVATMFVEVTAETSAGQIIKRRIFIAAE